MNLLERLSRFRELPEVEKSDESEIVVKGPGLYVARPVVNTEQFRVWAKDLGLPELDANLHVTIVHSRDEVPWVNETDEVVIPNYSYTEIRPIGDEGAVALFFPSGELESRWRWARQDGATWDFPGGYRPHMTLFYQPGFNGEIPLPHFDTILGPEVSGPVNRDVFKLEKYDEEKRLIAGWASVVEHPDGTPVVDVQGDVIDLEELRKAAHSFMQKSRELGDNHKIKKGIGKVVESLVVDRDIKKALRLPADTPHGWFIVAKVDNEETWDRVRKGEYLSFSIGGSGSRTKIG